MGARLLGTVRGAAAVALLATGMGAVGGLGIGLASSGVASATGTKVTAALGCTAGTGLLILVLKSSFSVTTATASLHTGTTHTVAVDAHFTVTITLVNTAIKKTVTHLTIAGATMTLSLAGFTDTATVKAVQTGKLTVPLEKTTAASVTLVFKHTVKMTATSGTATIKAGPNLDTTILVKVKCKTEKAGFAKKTFVRKPAPTTTTPTFAATPAVTQGPINTIAVAKTTLTITTTSLPTGAVTASYTATLTATGGTGTYDWTATGLPPGLTLTHATGKITHTPTATHTGTVKVTVTDLAGKSTSKTLPLTINGPLSVKSGTLPTATVGTAYSTTLPASGGLTPYTWSTTASSLPTGLSLAPTGKLSGTPTKPGTFSFGVLLTGGTARVVTGRFKLKVAPKPLTITTTSLPGGVVGVHYTTTLTASGGTGTFTWSATTLPTGLTLATTGNLSGTPTKAGTFSTKVTVKDGAGTTAKKTLPITIGPALKITTTTLPAGTVGTGYSATLKASGGETPYTWSATGLPTGLKITPSTGAISGTPTKARTFFTVIVSVKGATGITVKATFTVKVTPAPLTIATTSLPTGVVTKPYLATLKAAGGSGTVFWTVTAKSLPPGLQFTTTTTTLGKISGTPTKVGTYKVKVTVTDTAGQTASATLPLTVNPKLALTTASLPAGAVGKAYATTLKASGGLTPYTWSAATLPPGLTVGATTGVISGTPTAAGKYTVKVTVTGATGTKKTATLAITVTKAAIGYWEVASDGGIFSFGTATFQGSMGGKPLNKPIVGMAATPTGGGYWEVASDGGIFSFGNAQFYGSMGGKPLNAPIVGMAATPTGGGYWEVASDGGIFSFGDAHFYGSMGGKPLNKPIVGIAADPTGMGYWEVASDGGIFSFGNAHFYGSMGGKPLNKPIVGIAASTGMGYWEVASDGGIFSFGTATFQGSMGGKPLNKPIVGMAATPTGGGYWEVASDGGIFSFGNATFQGSMGGKPLNKPVVGMAAS
jgi:hypothetical protein